MKKAKIYKPSKTATQSGLKKFDKWILEFITNDPTINPLMGWESSMILFRIKNGIYIKRDSSRLCN